MNKLKPWGFQPFILHLQLSTLVALGLEMGSKMPRIGPLSLDARLWHSRTGGVLWPGRAHHVLDVQNPLQQFEAET